MKIYFTLFKIELLQYYRNLHANINTIFFYLILMTLFPLAITLDNQILKIIGPGVIWVSFLLAILLSCDNLFQKNIENGVLEQIIISRISIPMIVSIKAFAHWIAIIIPLVLTTPVGMLLFHLNIRDGLVLNLTLLIGTPSIVMIMSFASALTISLKNNGLVLIILVIPLIIPIIITAVGCVYLSSIQLPYTGQVALLLAALVFTCLFSPFLIAYVLVEGC